MPTHLQDLEEALYQKQLQINCILNITQAINNNESAEELFNRFLTFLNREMLITKMAFLVWEEKEWSCACQFNFDNVDFILKNPQLFLEYKHISKLGDPKRSEFEGVGFIIPIRHKNEPIAFVMIGFGDSNDDEYNKIKFITTISNVIAVAIENKRLFKRQVEQERLRQEMEVASQVQKMLIPTELPANKSYGISTFYQPHANVGGDFISCVEVQKNKLAVCIADVSGKGVPAALLMANFQAVYQSASNQFRDLKQMVRYINKQIYNITRSERFITCFFGVYNTEEGILRYVNAGHNPPVMWNRGSTTLLKEGTTLLGAFEELPFLQVGEICVQKGCILVCYTDGLVELQNTSGDFYQEQRLIDFIQNNDVDNDKDFTRLLLEEIDEFRGEAAYSDDIAVLTLSFKYDAVPKVLS